MNRREFTKSLAAVGALMLTSSNVFSQTTRGKLKITDIQVLPIDRYLFVQIHTDAGITGLGESGAWGFLAASGAAVDTFKGYLIG